jgi:dienelactone hydrolase
MVISIAASENLAARWRLLRDHARVSIPAGPGPHPTVLMFHGCGGRSSAIGRYIESFLHAGLGVIDVDSFGPRGWSRPQAIATVCTGLTLQGWRRAGDVLAALWGARQMSEIDFQRLALAGWSHGGWSLMDLMTMPLTRPGEAGLSDPDPSLLDGVRALALAYPYCGPGALTQLRPWRRTPEVFAFVGERDRVAHPAFCRRAFRAAQRSGARLETWFPDATHDFDVAGSLLAFYRHNPALADEAVVRMTTFLADQLNAKRSAHLSG